VSIGGVPPMTTRILLCLLTFATSAQAESAWVLWSQMIGTVEKELGIHASYPSREMCVAELDSTDRLPLAHHP
jgi:hypothetical protein